MGSRRDYTAKAKYYPVTDSEQVPWGKGEKQPGEGGEIDPETITLTKTRSTPLILRNYLLNIAGLRQGSENFSLLLSFNNEALNIAPA